MDPIEAIISDVLAREGWPKYTNRLADRGGPTKGGITLATLTRWRGRPVHARDVEALDEAEVRAIYRRLYVEDPGYAGIADPGLRALVVDCGVLYGADGDDASAWLQGAAVALGADLRVDKRVGPVTLSAVNALPAPALYTLVVAARLRKMGGVIAADARARRRTEDQALNAGGWSNRLADLLEAPVLAAAAAG